MNQKDKDPNSVESKATALRRRAEEMLGDPAKILDDLSLEETQKLCHELQVHQIELEIQNEELRQAQLELETARDRFSDLYDFAPMGYFTVSEAGFILGANLTLAGMLGLERGKLIKKPLPRFIFKDDQDIYYLHRKQLFKTLEPQSCEMRLVRADETWFWAYVEGKIAEDSGYDEPVCWSVVSDITEKVQVEQELSLYRDHLEEEVGLRTKELREEMDQKQILLDAMVDRELRMVELKKVIKVLRTQLIEAGFAPLADDPLVID